MPKKKVLLITGQIGAGKDSLAQNLQYHYGLNFAIKKAFADRLKESIRDIYGIPTHLLWGSQEDKNTPTNIRRTNGEGYYTIRELMHVFSDLAKSLDNYCWVRIIGNFINSCVSTPNDCVGYWKNYQYFFISDWRFTFEQDFLISHCPDAEIRTLKLLRVGDSNSHNSEVMVNDKSMSYNWIIDNNNLSRHETYKQTVNLIDGWIKS